MQYNTDDIDFNQSLKVKKTTIIPPREEKRRWRIVRRFLSLGFSGFACLHTIFPQTDELKKQTPLKMNPQGVFNIALSGANILILVILGKEFDKDLPQKLAIKKPCKNQEAPQSVSNEVFDKLIFKNLPQTKKETTVYSALDKETLKARTALLDCFCLTPKEQQTVLQNIIDACEKYPALARLFRLEIFPITLLTKNNCSDTNTPLLNNIMDDDYVINYKNESIFEPDYFIPKEIHHIQNTKELLVVGDGDILRLSNFFMEVYARSYEALCFPKAYNKPLRTYLYRQTQLSVQEADIKFPTPSLSQSEKERYMTGTIQDKTIAQLMGLFLTLPCDIEQKITRNKITDKLYNYKLTAITRIISAIHLGYEHDQAFILVEEYPDITRQLLKIYSALFNCRVEISNPQKAVVEFQKMREKEDKIIKRDLVLAAINGVKPKYSYTPVKALKGDKKNEQR